MEQSPTDRSAGRQAGLLFGAAGILTILNDFVPGSGYLDEAFLHVVGVVCIAVGAGVALLPWERWPARATLAITPLAFAVMSDHAPDGALSSVTVAVPVCLLVAETIARTVGRMRRAERDILHSYELLHRSQALANVGSWEWDVTTGAVEWSPAMYRILGVAPGEIETAFEPVLDLVVPEDKEMVTARFREAARGGTVPGFAFRLTRPDGARRWMWCEGGPSGDGRPGVVTGFVQDVTEPKQVEEELSRLALRDDLTGLANRRAFVTVGQQLLRLAQRAGETALLIYIDLDNMKEVNDTHGHAAARQGNEGKAGLERLREAVDARKGHFPPVALSIGTSTYDGDGPCSIENLIDRADAAMYAEKALRRLQ